MQPFMQWGITEGDRQSEQRQREWLQRGAIGAPSTAEADEPPSRSRGAKLQTGWPQPRPVRTTRHGSPPSWLRDRETYPVVRLPTMSRSRSTSSTSPSAGRTPSHPVACDRPSCQPSLFPCYARFSGKVSASLSESPKSLGERDIEQCCQQQRDGDRPPSKQFAGTLGLRDDAGADRTVRIAKHTHMLTPERLE